MLIQPLSVYVTGGGDIYIYMYKADQEVLEKLWAHYYFAKGVCVSNIHSFF